MVATLFLALFPFIGKKDEMTRANGIIYLLSDASSWITGQSLVIDGGRTL